MHMQIIDWAIWTSPSLTEGARPLTGSNQFFCSHWCWLSCSELKCSLSLSLSIPLCISLHPQSRMASCGSCFWCVIWLVVLLCIGWPLSITLGGLYGLISPLTTCLGLDHLSDLLLEGANIGRTCANNMRHCKPLCWGLLTTVTTDQPVT